MTDETETPPPSRAGGGHGLGKKIGPFPLGAWAVILGGIVGVVFFLRRGGSAGQAADAAAAGSGQDTPTSLVPVSEGLAEAQTDAILAAIKRLHGKPSTDDDDDDDDDDKTTLPGKLPHPPPKPPKPKPRPKPHPPQHHHRYVTTVKWHRGHVPWNSTLWGIAKHEHVKGGWQYLQRVNHIKSPPKAHLQPGMKIRVD